MSKGKLCYAVQEFAWCNVVSKERPVPRAPYGIFIIFVISFHKYYNSLKETRSDIFYP